MKVLLINGSPRREGNTFIALSEEARPLDDWTFNKSIQKITESLRVGPDDKEFVRAMRRGTK